MFRRFKPNTPSVGCARETDQVPCPWVELSLHCFCPRFIHSQVVALSSASVASSMALPRSLPVSKAINRFDIIWLWCFKNINEIFFRFAGKCQNRERSGLRDGDDVRGRVRGRHSDAMGRRRHPGMLRSKARVSTYRFNQIVSCVGQRAQFMRTLGVQLVKSYCFASFRLCVCPSGSSVSILSYS